MIEFVRFFENFSYIFFLSKTNTNCHRVLVFSLELFWTQLNFFLIKYVRHPKSATYAIGTNFGCVLTVHPGLTLEKRLAGIMQYLCNNLISCNYYLYVYLSIYARTFIEQVWQEYEIFSLNEIGPKQEKLLLYIFFFETNTYKKNLKTNCQIFIVLL